MRQPPTNFRNKLTRGAVPTRLTLFWILLLAGFSVFIVGSSRSSLAGKVRSAKSDVIVSERQNGRRPGANFAATASAVSPVTPMPFAPINVDRTDDNASASACTAAPNDCSLRGAVTFANAVSGTTINLPAGTYNLTISGAGEGFSGNNAIGDLDIRANNTSIVGAGAATTTIQQTTTARVIEVNPNLNTGFNFSISGVTISGGQENTGVGGGGIISGGRNNTTTITDSVISGNSATGSGTFGGGGYCNTGGSVVISGTTFSGNSTSGSGGAVSYSAGDFLSSGSTGTLTLTGSTFSSNTASSSSSGGGAIDVFNFNLGNTSASISTSSFSTNNASNGRGGALIVESGTVNVQYSRLVGNTAATGGRTVHRSGGTLTADNNWWGANSGPSLNANSGGSILVWLQLRASATPDHACAGTTVNMSADIYGTGSSGGPGSPVLNCPGGSCALNGLPAFAGTVGSTSTQFVNGAASGSFVSGSGSATANADSQTVNANFTVDAATTASDPADQAVCAGAMANFSTTAGGTGPFHYAWTLDGNAYDGDNASISIDTTGFSFGNHTVGVTVTGACGSASQSATLTVNSPTTTSDPADQTVCQGAMATFSTTAGGSGPFSYAWTLDGNPTGGNSPSVTINTGSLSGNHTVSVTTTGACGNASQSATLTVNTPTTTTDPPDQTVCQGTDATFSTTAGGTGPFSYAWTLDGNPTGANSSSVTINTSSLSGSHTVSVTTTGACGTASQSATLTVNTPTTTTDPPDQTVCQGAMATFSTTAGGTGPHSYAWTLDGNPTGTNSSSVTIDTSSLSGTHTVSVTTTGACGSASQSATLTVNTPTTTTDPPDQTVCQGAMATFSTTAGGTGPHSYAWTLDGNPTGTNSSSVTINTSSLSGAHTVSVTTTGACGSASQSATLTVNTPTTTTDPPDQTICEGGSASFSTTAGGTGPFHYAWTVDGVAAGGDSSSLNVSGATVGNHTVSVTTTGACGSASQSATLTVNANTTTTDPADQSVCEGATANFSTTAGGTGPFSYAWTVDSVPYGGNSSSISVNTTGFSQGAHTVTVTTTGACGSASQSATLNVNNGAPTITVANSSISMWPPNHQYQNFTLADFGVTASSNCDGNLTSSVVIVSVTSDELDDNPGGGDGNTVNDMVIAANCKSVQLRRERDGNLNGRVYTVTFAVTDSVGHTTTATAQVIVPLNQSGGGAVNSGVHNTVNGTCP